MFFKMRDKEGMLLAEETLKMVVAVICIGFLIYFLTYLYFSKVGDEKVKQAEEILDKSSESVRVVISDLKEGEFRDMAIINPDGWYLMGFTGDNPKPNSCAGENCLCLCDILLDVNFWGSQVKECGDDGYCLIVEDLRIFEPIEIKKDLTFVVFEKKGGRTLVREK